MTGTTKETTEKRRNGKGNGNGTTSLIDNQQLIYEMLANHNRHSQQPQQKYLSINKDGRP
jgi:hypothetical protein